MVTNVVLRFIHLHASKLIYIIGFLSDYFHLVVRFDGVSYLLQVP